jgi:hypothetical protein
MGDPSLDNFQKKDLAIDAQQLKIKMGICSSIAKVLSRAISRGTQTFKTHSKQAHCYFLSDYLLTLSLEFIYKGLQFCNIF